MNYYDFAKKDLLSADTMYKYTEEYDVIVVHCQQYIEKSLKYLLEIKCGELSKSHKLTVLSNKLQIKELDTYDNIFRKIQDYYFDKRYPGDNYIITSKSECDEVYTFTKDIVTVIEYLIKTYSKREFSRSNAFNNIK
ncbi:MAG: HEPN domain-containing protein [Anaeroplasmataceae bacterium]